LRHGCGVIRLRHAVLRIQHRQPRAPFQIAHQGGAEFRIGGQADLIHRLQHQRDPALALGFGEMPAHVTTDHMGMAAAGGRVRRAAAEHFRDESGDMLGMMRVHAGEHRRQYGIVRHFLIETLGERGQPVRAAQPLR
jgi:hypothetical protein